MLLKCLCHLNTQVAEKSIKTTLTLDVLTTMIAEPVKQQLK